MYQPYPSSGEPVEPLRPPVPAPVRTAVKLMYAGAAISTVQLIIALAYVGGGKAAIRKAHPRLTATQVSELNMLFIALAIVSGLVVIALWLWMARANGRGRNWARILSTVLFAVATLELIRNRDLAEVFWALTWLVGLAAVWLLWRPASSAFFKPQSSVQMPPATPTPPGQPPRSR
jgi:hypothetical protein